jgi:hypothetical protein
MNKDRKILAYIIGYGLAIGVAILTSCTSKTQDVEFSEIPNVSCHHCGESVIMTGDYISMHVDRCTN